MTLDTWVSAHVAAAVGVLVFLGVRGVLRPGSLARGKRDVTPHPVWLWLGCAGMILLVQAVGAGVGASLFQIDLGNTPTVQGQGVVAACIYALGIAVAVLLTRLVAISAPAAGLRVTPRSLALGVGCFLLAWPVVAAVGLLMRWVAGRFGQDISDDLAHPTLRLVTGSRGDPWAWVLIACAVVGAPLVEEITYRAFVQSAALRITGRPGVAVVLAAAAFTAVHIGAGIPWYAIVPIGVLGLAMGFAFERTKSIGVPITMHVLFNAVNMAMALLIEPS